MNELTEALGDAFSLEVGYADIGGFLLSGLLTALLAIVLGKVYVRFGRSLSNREAFAANFVVIGLTTMMIISIVKTSIALSLGLVGALSIVRFRTAIKEPEELAYLFFIIALGLGMGADKVAITLAGFALLLGVLLLRGRVFEAGASQSLYLTIASARGGESGVRLEQLVSALQEHCERIDLKRFDENDEQMEASFAVRCRDYGRLERLRDALQKLDPRLRIGVVDTQ